MLITMYAAAPGASFDILESLNKGGIVSWSTAIILTLMLFVSLYILLTKLFEQQKVINEGKRVRGSFWSVASMREGAAKLDKNSAYRQIVEDGIKAEEEHKLLTDPVEAHDWLHASLARSEAQINSDLGSGLAFLATVGATAPFIGLFGTVVGIFRALIEIGAKGDASIATVAAPVGEALIMTALGLVTAVPAVLAFNWLQRRNKSIAEDLNAFSNAVLAFLASNGAVRPDVKKKGSTPTKPTTTAGQKGGVQPAE